MIRLGTRGSDLALRQSSMVTEKLRAGGAEVEVVIIQVRGDQTDKPFREIEGKAFFTKELDEALLEKKIDLAIHSLKDLPTEDPPGLVTLCVLPRADARDVLLLRGGVTVLRDANGPALPQGITLGTSSARRVAQLELGFPGVKVVELRGNVPTRVAKLRRGEYDGILIAQAGVERLSLDLKDLTSVRLDPPQFLPAPGQGVLAARVRAEDVELARRVRALEDAETATCARAERALLEKLDGGCSLPLGALAKRVRGRVVMDACLARDGKMRRCHVEAADPAAAAEAAARELLGQPAKAAEPEAAKPAPSATPAPPAAPAAQAKPAKPTAPAEPVELPDGPAPVVPTVLVTRPDGLDHELVRVLRDQGLAVVSQPSIQFEHVAVDDRMRAHLRSLQQFDLVAFTSRHAVRAFAQAAKKLGSAVDRIKRTAALGQATELELQRHGMKADLVSDGSGALALAELIANRSPPNTQVLHPGAANPEPTFSERLAKARIKVTLLPLYQTRAITDDPDLPQGVNLAILASPSAARAFLARPRVRAALAARPVRLLLVAGGATTLAEMQRLGVAATIQARSPATEDLVPAVADALEKLAREVPA